MEARKKRDLGHRKHGSDVSPFLQNVCLHYRVVQRQNGCTGGSTWVLDGVPTEIEAFTDFAIRKRFGHIEGAWFYSSFCLATARLRASFTSEANRGSARSSFK